MSEPAAFSDREAIRREVERLRAAIEAPQGSGLSPAELRLRIDAVADLILVEAGGCAGRPPIAEPDGSG